MNIIKEILKIVDILMLLYMLYYVFTLIFLVFKKKHIKKHKNACKFAVIIPARNEERVIGNLIESLKAQNYPKELYDIFVIPNNCDDKTEEIAIEKEAQIINCAIPVKSKGDVLRYTFNYLEPCNYDAYIIFDADNIVHPEFLSKANGAVLEGYNVAQGYRDSKNPEDSWISDCYSLHYWIQNIFLNQVRMNANLSSFINGTGVIITKNFIEEHGYQAETMTEDIELAVQCAIKKEKIAFVEEAITYDEQVTSLKESLKQRLRWSIGTIQCLMKYSKELIKEESIRSIDMLLFLLAPVTQVIGSLAFIAHIMLGIVTRTPINYMSKCISIILCYSTSIIISVIALKISNKPIMKNIKGILTYPIFLFTWIPLNAIALFKRKYKWKQIKHTKAVSIDKMMELAIKS